MCYRGLLFNTVGVNFVLREVLVTFGVTQTIGANFANAGSNIELEN